MSEQINFDPASIEYQVKEKLAALEEALKEGLPNIAAILRPLHKQLKDDPDIVTTLTEEECAIIAKGLAKQTAVNITEKLTKTTSRKKSLSKTTVDDL